MARTFQGLFAKDKELAMSQTTRRIALFFCFALSLGVLSNMAQAQTYTVLFDLGFFPYGSLTLDQQGRIYGTLSNAGANGGGDVYRLQRVNGSWVLTTLYSFGYQDLGGSNPQAGVAIARDGTLYGTTSDYGAFGYGTVYRLQPSPNRCSVVQCPWIKTTVYNFTGGTDGGYPGYGTLVFDHAGNIYGTTNEGGSHGTGVVYKLAPSGGGWTESVIFDFPGEASGGGGLPIAGVIFDSAGNLYGTSTEPPAVYELSPTQSGWTETTLSTQGGGFGGLTFDAHGNLFGMTGNGPGGGDASVYELTPENGSWTFSVLHDFGMEYVAPASAPIFDSHGNLYGPLPTYPEQGLGEIFKLTPSGNQWTYTPYYQFTGGTGGAGPLGGVIFDASGNMYGTTADPIGGGAITVWEITP